PSIGGRAFRRVQSLRHLRVHADVRIRDLLRGHPRSGPARGPTRLLEHAGATCAAGEPGRARHAARRGGSRPPRPRPRVVLPAAAHRPGDPESRMSGWLPAYGTPMGEAARAVLVLAIFYTLVVAVEIWHR